MTLAVLLVAVLVVALVLSFASRFGGKGPKGGTSLRRGPRAHTTRRGSPKVGYATRADALAVARQMKQRGGDDLAVYQCATCAHWHLGH